jgi:hypothetical protein
MCGVVLIAMTYLAFALFSYLVFSNDTQPFVNCTLADPAMPISPTYVAAGCPLCIRFVNPSHDTPTGSW